MANPEPSTGKPKRKRKGGNEPTATPASHGTVNWLRSLIGVVITAAAVAIASGIAGFLVRGCFEEPDIKIHIRNVVVSRDMSAHRQQVEITGEITNHGGSGSTVTIEDLKVLPTGGPKRSLALPIARPEFIVLEPRDTVPVKATFATSELNYLFSRAPAVGDLVLSLEYSRAGNQDIRQARVDSSSLSAIWYELYPLQNELPGFTNIDSLEYEYVCAEALRPLRVRAYTNHPTVIQGDIDCEHRRFRFALGQPPKMPGRVNGIVFAYCAFFPDSTIWPRGMTSIDKGSVKIFSRDEIHERPLPAEITPLSEEYIWYAFR